jgi:hypothetical protein
LEKPPARLQGTNVGFRGCEGEDKLGGTVNVDLPGWCVGMKMVVVSVVVEGVSSTLQLLKSGYIQGARCNLKDRCRATAPRARRLRTNLGRRHHLYTAQLSTHLQFHGLAAMARNREQGPVAPNGCH